MYIRILNVAIRRLVSFYGTFSVFEPHINERAYRNQPLTKQQKATYWERSKNRAKVEHVFGEFVTSMGGKLVHSIGLARAKTQLGLKNPVYNL